MDYVFMCVCLCACVCVTCRNSINVLSFLGSYLVVNSLFKNGGSIGKGSVIVNSVFEKRTVVPANTIVVNSHGKFL